MNTPEQSNARTWKRPELRRVTTKTTAFGQDGFPDQSEGGTGSGLVIDIPE